MSLIARAYWLALPVALAGVLHMVAVKRRMWRSLEIPIDGGRSWRGRRLFGANKTWRGVVFMVCVAGAVGAVQGALGGDWAHRNGIELLDFWALGQKLGGGYAATYACVHAVLGLAYVAGELPNSFVKRQLDIEPGQRATGAYGWVGLIVDRIDSVAAVVLAMLAFGVDMRAAIVAFGCFIALHLVLNGLMVISGVRRSL